MTALETKRVCEHCGHQLHDKRYLMSADPSKPGFGALLRGEGDDPLLVTVARLAGLLAVFAAAVLVFWALGLAML